jgi:hypothetical protein
VDRLEKWPVDPNSTSRLQHAPHFMYHGPGLPGVLQDRETTNAIESVARDRVKTGWIDYQVCCNRWIYLYVETIPKNAAAEATSKIHVKFVGIFLHSRSEGGKVVIGTLARILADIEVPAPRKYRKGISTFRYGKRQLRPKTCKFLRAVLGLPEKLRIDLRPGFVKPVVTEVRSGIVTGRRDVGIGKQVALRLKILRRCCYEDFNGDQLTRLSFRDVPRQRRHSDARLIMRVALNTSVIALSSRRRWYHNYLRLGCSNEQKTPWRCLRLRAVHQLGS